MGQLIGAWQYFTISADFQRNLSETERNNSHAGVAIMTLDVGIKVFAVRFSSISQTFK